MVGGRRIGMLRLAGAVLALSAAAVGSSSCARATRPPGRGDPHLVARAERLASGVSVLAGAPDVLAAGVARTLFWSAPVVVVAGAGRPGDVSAAAAWAGRAHAPLLLGRGATVGTVTRAEIGSLHPRAVLAVGVGRAALTAQLRGTRVVTRPAALPATNALPPLGHVLDLQAGRASLLTQARKYEPLLERPNVGLALDPEWKLQPRQRPLRQIGSVSAREVNSVSNWLAGLTARHHLPQKLLVLHQFRLSMIGDEDSIGTRHDDLAIVIHMDGQGTPADKQQTWQAATRAAPRHVFFGWKNFYSKDHPMLSPRQTMAKTPKPVMISYQ